MMSIGVDLAAQATKTALCRLDWSPGRAVITKLTVGVEDEELLDASQEAERVGVDVPFGWPEGFVEAVVAHSRSATPGEMLQRSHLRWRATDRFVNSETGLRPLSVSTDKIGATALRWAVLERKLRATGIEVDRTGAGRFVEVYPAAALFQWGLSYRRYKRAKRRDALAELVGVLAGQATYLEMGSHRNRLEKDDDAFDALFSSLVARAAHMGLTQPPGAHAEKAAIEGWIHLPAEGSLEVLARP